MANADRCAGKMFEVDLDNVVGIGVDDNEVLFHFLTADGVIHEYDINGDKTDFVSMVRLGRGKIDDGFVRGWHPFYAEDGSIDVALVLTDTQVLFHTPEYPEQAASRYREDPDFAIVASREGVDLTQ